MEKVLKKILLFIPIFVIFNFSIMKVKAEELTSIYTLSNQMPAINDIGNTSFGNYDTISNLELFDSYNFNFQLNYNAQDLQYWLLLYNHVNDYYVLYIDRNQIAYGQDNYFVLTEHGLGSYYQLDSSHWSTQNIQPFFYGLYDSISTNDKIATDYGTTFGNYKTLNNFYICQKNGYYQNFTKITYQNYSDYYYIDSSFDFYVDFVLQQRYVPEEPEEPEDPTPTPTPPVEENLNKFYVPNYQEGQCIEVLDKDTLRVFENENSNNYTDYFINSHYISKTGQVEISYQKNCSSLEFTSIGYYRNDFSYILLIVGSLSLFSIFFLYVLYKRFRKR